MSPQFLAGLEACTTSQVINASPGQAPSAPPQVAAQPPQVAKDAVADRFSRSSGVTAQQIGSNQPTVLAGATGDTFSPDNAIYAAAEVTVGEQQTEPDNEAFAEGDGEEGIVASLSSHQRVTATGGAFSATA